MHFENGKVNRVVILEYKGVPLTEECQQVLSFAEEEAVRFNHKYIGTEHQLLGLVRLADSRAGLVLESLGVRLDKVRNAVEFIIGRGDMAVAGGISLTPRAKVVMSLAVQEKMRVEPRSKELATHHILLGMIREGEGIAAGILETLGVNLERARAAVHHQIDEVRHEMAEQAEAADPPTSEPESGNLRAETLAGLSPALQEVQALAFSNSVMVREENRRKKAELVAALADFLNDDGTDPIVVQHLIQQVTSALYLAEHANLQIKQKD